MTGGPASRRVRRPLSALETGVLVVAVAGAAFLGGINTGMLLAQPDRAGTSADASSAANVQPASDTDATAAADAFAERLTAIAAQPAGADRDASLARVQGDIAASRDLGALTAAQAESLQSRIDALR